MKILGKTQQISFLECCLQHPKNEHFPPEPTLVLVMCGYLCRKLRAGGEGGNRGLDSWMASSTWWTWVWANSERWWWQGSLACCSPWGHKESDTTEQLNWLKNWFYSNSRGNAGVFLASKLKSGFFPMCLLPFDSCSQLQIHRHILVL